MRLSKTLSLLMLALGLPACGSGALAGTWIGDLVCDDFNFEWEMSLSKDSGKLFTGSGSQTRNFTNIEGFVTDEKVEFDISLGMEESGPQDLVTEITCTYEDIVIFPPNGADPETVAEGCTPRLYTDYVVAWDGSDKLTLVGADGCSGELTRR
jgi:hypothetical protein